MAVETQQYFEGVTRRAGIEQRIVSMLADRLGVYDGEYRPLWKVGVKHGGVTRERVRQLLAKAFGKMPTFAVNMLGKYFPRPATKSEQRSNSRRIKRKLKEYFRDRKIRRIDYLKIAGYVGFDPDWETVNTAQLTEEDACMLMYSRFGITYFGKYRICLHCENGKGKALPVGEFYSAPQNAGGLWSICKTCNLARCRRWTKQKRNHERKFQEI